MSHLTMLIRNASTSSLGLFSFVVFVGSLIILAGIAQSANKDDLKAHRKAYSEAIILVVVLSLLLFAGLIVAKKSLTNSESIELMK